MAYIGTYLLLSVALFLLFLVTGSIADPLSRGLAPTGVERYLLRLTSGLAAWVAALFLIAATGRLGPIAVSLLASAAVTAALALWLRRRGAPGPRREPALPVDVVTRLGMAALAVIATALLLQTLRPIVAWDADVYHLTVPRIWLERGGFARIPFNVYSNWPSNVQLLFGLAMIVRDYVLAKTIHFGLGIALLVGLGWWVGRRSSAAWGIVAAAALLTLPVFLYEIRVAYVDIALALFLFLAFVFCERALSAGAAQGRRWLLFSGVACGLATGTKVNGVAGALAVAGVFVGSSLLSGRRPGDLLRPLGALAAPIAAFAALWTAKSAWLTGNPIYPLLHRWLGGPEWS
ncbi:MAG: phospholipid carrier-dependent glycosyltransferase, partial [Thermoanaerobaculia bacterium]|nr:phospholipid carrier-dependent glycosyltransferase [Thermoanaerobaculia bacterium]